MSERLYGEDEVREIFERAAGASDPEGKALSAGHGLTLSDLEGIGAEVGLEPAAIRSAAQALDTVAVVPVRKRLLGLPVSAGRTVEIPRAPTDHEWELLVAELRRVFAAKGKTASTGNLREWTNGNLHILVEPTESGHQLRMGTYNSSAGAIVGMGAMNLGIATLFAAMAAAGEGQTLWGVPFFVLLAVVPYLISTVRLPRWAEERDEQMQWIGERAVALLSRPAKETD